MNAGREDLKRKDQRRELFYSFEVLDKNGRFIGHIADLTLEGMKLTGRNPVKLNTVESYAVKLPERISRGKELILEAECVWCKEAGDGFHTGFKIVNHGSRQNQGIIKIIMELLASPDELIL